LFSFEFLKFVFCKHGKKRKEKDIVKVYVCVCMFFFMNVFIHDKISKIKEEFNI